MMEMSSEELTRSKSSSDIDRLVILVLCLSRVARMFPLESMIYIGPLSVPNTKNLFLLEIFIWEMILDALNSLCLF